MKSNKVKGIPQIQAEIPNIVLFVKMMAMMDMPIGYEMYEKAITEHPEHFPEEVEYRRKWSLVPQELKDQYNNTCFTLDVDYDEFADEIGKPPYPEFMGKGIIWTVTEGYDKYPQQVADNDEYNRKFFHLRHKKDIDLYNKLFSTYGLTKTYDEK